MESGSTSPHNKHKHMKKQKETECEDIVITKLPESLISRILSILPTKDAVRTSILSKRWIHLWRSVTKLELDDTVIGGAGGKQHFVNFVNRALLLTKSSLDSFSLTIDDYDDYVVSLIDTWIASVLSRNLKKLCIRSKQMEITFSYLTSDSLFNSKSLEELKLNMYAAITVPTSYVYLGHLKLLKLFEVKFTLDSSNHSKHLTLSFPVLIRLEIVNCTWLGAECVTFKVPLLERLYILKGPESPFHKPNCCPIEFSASNLIEFFYSGTFCSQQFIILLDPMSARNAYAAISLRHFGKDNSRTELCAFRLLTQFGQVTYLSFDEGSEILAQSRVAHLPTFVTLTHLKLGVVSVKVLLGLLLKMPVLQTLVFKRLLSEFDKELLDSTAVPSCLQHTLWFVKFGEVYGHAYELCLAKFVIENSLVLKRIIFNLAAGIDQKSKAFEEFKEKLSSFQKGSDFDIIKSFI